MKRAFISFLFAVSAFIALGAVANAQRNVTPTVDPVLESDAKHNLEVARQAFSPLKKAYKQVLMRFDETFAAYPDFTAMDEFLYMAGVSSYWLSEGKGKQVVNTKSEKEMKRFAPDRLKIDAQAFLSMLIDKYPQSKFKPDAEKTLAEIKSKQ
jgi:outer membrane protein assembly factor BamD (BamD/ComL family)